MLAARDTPRMALTVSRIDHLVINVSDVQASSDWYARVLGMRREVVDGRTVLWFGEQKLHMRPIDASQEAWFTGRHPAAGSDDLCFAACDAELPTSPRTWRRAALRSRSGPSSARARVAR